MIEYFEIDYPTGNEMTEYEEEPPYSFEEMIQKLEHIKKNGDGPFSFSKGIYCLAKEIEIMKTKIDRIYDAMRHPCKDENK